MVMDIFGALLGHILNLIQPTFVDCPHGLNKESLECGRFCLICFFVIPQQRPFYINQCWVGIRKNVRIGQGFKLVLCLKLSGYHLE
jgi:hypothetical protein